MIEISNEKELLTEICKTSPTSTPLEDLQIRHLKSYTCYVHLILKTSNTSGADPVYLVSRHHLVQMLRNLLRQLKPSLEDQQLEVLQKIQDLLVKEHPHP